MKRKAETIQTVLAWYAQYGYDVAAVQAVPKERLRQELLALKGIGEETADVPVPRCRHQASAAFR